MCLGEEGTVWGTGREGKGGGGGYGLWKNVLEIIGLDLSFTEDRLCRSS